MITVLGASGFIGSRLVHRLTALGMKHRAVGRRGALPSGPLGHVVYCIGLTADFRSRPFDTVEAHVSALLEVLRRCDFESLLYLSSTRLYGASESTSEESPIRVAPLEPGDLYQASKALGEAIVLNCGYRTRVARLSNVYGDDFASGNFLSTIISDAIDRRTVVLRTSAGSEKDYISVAQVVDGLIRIATQGNERIYNLASGRNVSNRQVAAALRELTGCRIEYSPSARLVRFPPIDIHRLRNEFDFQGSRVLNDLPELVDAFRHQRHQRESTADRRPRARRGAKASTQSSR